VCQLARKRVTVALSGDGGDESFGGYRRYRQHLVDEGRRSALPLSLRRRLFGVLGRMYPTLEGGPRFLRAKSTLEGLARDPVEAYFNSMSIFRDGMRHQLFSDTFRRQLAGYNAVEVFRAHAAKAGTDDALALVQYLDLKTYLVGDINTKVDRASMAHSLEVREPLMDHPLVEWLGSLPSAMKVRGSEGKWLLKKAMEPHLPNEVLYRPKMGFAVPLANWFRGALRDVVRTRLLDGNLQVTGFFGRRDYSAALWALVMFEGFLGAFGDCRKEATR
jgi:asparagine synthase (glutamine-hydrolysing)